MVYTRRCGGEGGPRELNLNWGSRSEVPIVFIVDKVVLDQSSCCTIKAIVCSALPY